MRQPLILMSQYVGTCRVELIQISGPEFPAFRSSCSEGFLSVFATKEIKEFLKRSHVLSYLRFLVPGCSLE